MELDFVPSDAPAPAALWRISNHRDLDGLGGERTDGRWHTAARGKRIVYLSEHPAVALVETLANLRGDARLFPDHFQLMKMAGAGGLAIQQPSSECGLPPSETPSLVVTQAFGNAWLASRASALLRVPSVPSPESWNYLLNPQHPHAAFLRMEWVKNIAYDRRLFHLSSTEAAGR